MPVANATTRRSTPATLRAGVHRSARRRAAALKAALLAMAAVLFGSGMVFAKDAYAGHAKEPVSTLEAPPRFVKIVKRNLLEAGVLAPAQAPADAATSVS